MRIVIWAALALMAFTSPALAVEEDFWFDKPFEDEVRKEQPAENEGEKEKVDCTRIEEQKRAAEDKVDELKGTIKTQQEYILAQREVIRRLRAELLHQEEINRGLFQLLQRK